MKALIVNAVCGIKSTGRICTDSAKELEKQGYCVKIAYSRDYVPDEYKEYAVQIGNKIDVLWHALMTKVFDQRGYWSRRATNEFIKWADEYNPDLLWIHNIHDYVVNIDLFFDWIKSRPEMEVKWTQHDCWAFTGDCMHYMTCDCKQWKTQCERCPEEMRRGLLPVLHREKENFLQKKSAFSNVAKMTIITPCNWMANQVKESFLKKYPVEVIHNTIDEKVFKPTHGDFRKRYNLEEKFIVLGVASFWSASKGLYDYYKLSELLDERYQIILVGLTKKQLKDLPKNIIGIERTDSKRELAEIYTEADVFVNLTYADNYPTVNLEARACGARIITYNTGGSPESAGAGALVFEKGDVEGVAEAITNYNNT